jgi:hypothetical protein
MTAAAAAPIFETASSLVIVPSKYAYFVSLEMTEKIGERCIKKNSRTNKNTQSHLVICGVVVSASPR